MYTINVTAGDTIDKYAPAAKKILEGGLVAFPTETVYGLGANGLDVGAIHKIFQVKRRPLSDPVILHVATYDDALKLHSVNNTLWPVYSALRRAFWPGPMTIVAKATNLVPPILMGGSDSVGVRIPSHSIARKFLEATGTPVAAPSANLFGRVSPTTAEHVRKYFANEDVMLLESDQGCSIGLESSVIKLVESENAPVIIVLRAGHVTKANLEEVCPTVEVRQPDLSLSHTDIPRFGNDAPGQCLVHYSPSILTQLILRGHGVVPDVQPFDISSGLQKFAVLDITGCAADWEAFAGLYHCLVETDDAELANSKLFQALHRIEEESIQRNFKKILLVVSADRFYAPSYRALADRILKAAGHQVFYFNG